MNRDLFGGPLPKHFGRIPGIQQQLFEGAEWLGAAADWAAIQGLTVERLEAGRRFRCAGAWFAIAWNETTNDWEIAPC